MKKLLTVSVYQYCNETGHDALFDGLEIAYALPEESEAGLVARCISETKSKYIIFADRSFFIADLRSLLNAAEKSAYDILLFNGGAAYRTTVFKSVNTKNVKDAFTACAFAAMSSKSLLKLDCTPFTYTDGESIFTETTGENILNAVKEFKRVKSKLNKEVYAYVFEMLCERLIKFYMRSMIAVRSGKMSADELKAFDAELKDEIFLYLALEKRFTVKKLSSLRAKGFKISYFTENKFKKLLK